MTAAAGRRPGRRRQTSLICRTALIFRVLAISTPGLLSSPALADYLYVCAEQTDFDDGQDEWVRGPVIPAGAVLDQAGHVFGTIQDPEDSTHYADEAGAGWKAPPAGNDRRGKLLLEDMAADKKPKSGVVTTREVKLTRAGPYADVPAAAVFSPGWDWTVAPVFEDSTRYDQIHGGKRDTGFNEDETALDHLAARGRLNAVVRGAMTKVIRLSGANER